MLLRHFSLRKGSSLIAPSKIASPAWSDLLAIAVLLAVVAVFLIVVFLTYLVGY